jgi:hypothetical protein
MAEITDGTTNTLLVGDKRLNRSRLGQAQADDNEGYTCGWNEDTVRLISQRPQIDFLGDSSLFGGKAFGSSHPAAFSMALVDGSVRSFAYTVDVGAFKSLGEIDDGKAVSVDGL